MSALLDTSVFVAREKGIPLAEIPDEAAIAAMTVAELKVGVLMAATVRERSARLETLTMVEREFDPIPFDVVVARTYAEYVAELRALGRSVQVADAMIAATAATHGLVLYTRERRFDAYPDLDVHLLA